mmetsp:Transcript_11239/g.46873  ORF Transcript_11239/g.46873 Transcript_11239/m.46873 type:complete len:252 (+) Transcript_11239:2936-3691(+)
MRFPPCASWHPIYSGAAVTASVSAAHASIMGVGERTGPCMHIALYQKGMSLRPCAVRTSMPSPGTTPTAILPATTSSCSLRMFSGEVSSMARNTSKSGMAAMPMARINFCAWAIGSRRDSPYSNSTVGANPARGISTLDTWWRKAAVAAANAQVFAWRSSSKSRSRYAIFDTAIAIGSRLVRSVTSMSASSSSSTASPSTGLSFNPRLGSPGSSNLPSARSASNASSRPTSSMQRRDHVGTSSFSTHCLAI